MKYSRDRVFKGVKKKTTKSFNYGAGISIRKVDLPGAGDCQQWQGAWTCSMLALCEFWGAVWGNYHKEILL